jgi:hypothetical protein
MSQAHFETVREYLVHAMENPWGNAEAHAALDAIATRLRQAEQVVEAARRRERYIEALAQSPPRTTPAHGEEANHLLREAVRAYDAAEDQT